jgi:hypothetical protein
MTERNTLRAEFSEFQPCADQIVRIMRVMNFLGFFAIFAFGALFWTVILFVLDREPGMAIASLILFLAFIALLSWVAVLQKKVRAIDKHAVSLIQEYKSTQHQDATDG